MDPYARARRSTQLGCLAWALAWAAGFAAAIALGVLHDAGWFLIAALWAAGQPLGVLAWTLPGGLRGRSRHFARAGCMLLAFTAAAAAAAAVAGAMIASELVSGVSP